VTHRDEKATQKTLQIEEIMKGVGGKRNVVTFASDEEVEQMLKAR
jgi:hypothetical protein